VRLGRGTPEEKEARARQAAAERDARRLEKLRRAFYASPAGNARSAFENGDQVFQYEIDVRQTATVVVPMRRAYARPQGATDPTAILNSVCHEGWELVNGSFVFLETGSESRDKFLASGQQIAVKGSVIGYYLFKRCEANKRDVIDPWDAPRDPARPDDRDDDEGWPARTDADS
jgi:hypothetical protein